MVARRPWSRMLVSALALVSVLVVGLSAMDVTPAAAAGQSATAAADKVVPWAAAAAAKPKRVVEAADLVSARVAARAQGSRVEATSERSEFATTFVNPDGTLTTEASAARVRFRDRRNGNAWRDIDLSLREVAGQVAPTSSDLGVSLSAGGPAGSSFVTADHDANTVQPAGAGGRSVSWALGGKLAAARLPKPTLNGTTATYAGVAAGVDVRVQLSPSGFEQDFIVKDRGAADALAASGGSFEVPLRTKGLTAKPTADGGVEFVDGKGKRVSFVPAPFAWDAKVNPRSGEAPRVPVKLTVAQPSPGNATLTVTPDAGWLADPARVFPVTVDPSYTYAPLTVNTSFDTWVATNYPNNDESADPELKVGTYDGGTTIARSYLSFPIQGFHNYDIVTANLSLYEISSFSCTAKPVYAYWSEAAGSSTRWAAQPNLLSTTASGSATVAKGFSSSCAAAG